MSAQNDIRGTTTLLRSGPLRIALIRPRLAALGGTNVPARGTRIVLSFNYRLRKDLQLIYFKMRKRGPTALHLAFNRSITRTVDSVNRGGTAGSRALQSFAMKMPRFDSRRFNRANFHFIHVHLRSTSAAIALGTALTIFVCQSLPCLNAFHYDSSGLGTVFSATTCAYRLGVRQRL